MDFMSKVLKKAQHKGELDSSLLPGEAKVENGSQPAKNSLPIQEIFRRRSGNGNYKDTPGNAEIERLVAKLTMLRNESAKQSILITSAILGEGKSTIASLIARSMACNQNRATLLIDFDIRRPRLHHIFDLNREQGITDILNANLPVHACLKKTFLPNLTLLPSGNTPASHKQVINSDNIQSLLKEVLADFDNVIIDAPPILPVSDPLILATLVDQVLLVVKAGTTSRYVVKRAIDMFTDVNVAISGIILNNMKNVLPYYYDHKYYGYHFFNNKELKHG